MSWQAGSDRQQDSRDEIARANVTDFPSLERRLSRSRRLKSANAWSDTRTPQTPVESAASGHPSTFWTSVWACVMEGFALYAASIYPAYLLSEDEDTERHMPDQAARRSPALSPASPDDAGNRMPPATTLIEVPPRAWASGMRGSIRRTGAGPPG
jgi:hypothetical protein